MSVLQFRQLSAVEPVISKICGLNWPDLTEQDMVGAAWAYYFFSIQFRENLQIACKLHPDDKNLARLKQEECETDNLSPYPGIAAVGEKLNHDEFMRRALALYPIPDETSRGFHAGGSQYLKEVRAMSPKARALSIGNYENGGLGRLFEAMLQVPSYDNTLVEAFRFFMLEHIRFDSDPIQGHGALSLHITGDEEVVPLWDAFRRLLLAFVPSLRPHAAMDQDLAPSMPPAELCAVRN